MEESKQTGTDIISELNTWSEILSEQTAIGWDKIPDIELYMDQVVTFLERQMKIYRRNEEDKFLTPSMINNYTKDRVVPRAKSKKYSKDHIALIMILCSLKKVLSMPDLTSMFKDFKVNEDEQIEQFYEMFCDYQAQAIKNTTKIINISISQQDLHEEAESSEVEATAENNKSKKKSSPKRPAEASEKADSIDNDKEHKRTLLKNLALRLAIEAQIKSAAAEQLLDLAAKQ